MKEDSGPSETPIAFTISHQESPEPLKYRLLDMLGLKDFLIDRFVFKKPAPRILCLT